MRTRKRKRTGRKIGTTRRTTGMTTRTPKTKMTMMTQMMMI